MSAASFKSYVIEKFRRTDKDDEIYSATTDTILEMRNTFDFSDDQTETVTTAQITEIGQFQINMEANFGLLVADVMVVDNNVDDSYPLTKVSKARFDELYPNPRYAQVDTDKPKHYCIFQNKIWLGPVPDSTDYIYRISFSQQPAETINADTIVVPFTRLYRECVRHGVLMRLYQGKDAEKSNYFKVLYDDAFAKITNREKANSSSISLTTYQGI